MPVETQVISVGFGQGLDSKTDPKAAGKPVLLKDCIFTNPHQVRKRNGYDAMTLNIVGGGTIASPTMAKSYKNELVVAGTASGAGVFGQRLFSYSPSIPGWVDKGKYVSTKVSKQNISSFSPYFTQTSGTLNTSSAFLGNTALIAYTVPTALNTTAVYISVTDTVTGVKYASDLLIPGAFSSAKAVLLGSTQLAVIYWNSGSSKIAGITITVSLGSGVVFGSEIQIAGSVSAAPTYDIITTGTGAAISYWVGSGTTLTTKTLDTSLSATHSVDLLLAGSAVPISLSADASNNIWVYWCDSTTLGSETIFYTIFSSILTVVLSKTAVASSIFGPVNQISTIASRAFANTQDVYYSILTTGPGSGTFSNAYPVIYRGSADIIGTVDPGSPWLYNVDIYSKPIALNSTQYLAVVFLSSLFPTGFLIDLIDASPVAKFLPEQSEGITVNSVNAAMRSPGFINSLYSPSSSQIILNAGSINPGGLTTVVHASTAAGSQKIVPTNISLGSNLITFDFANIDSYQSLIQQDLLVLNGGLIYQYDGSYSSELGFSIDPDGINSTVTGSGGGIAIGNYVYYVVYQWVDSMGNLNQSAPSSPYVISPSAGSSSIVITAQVLSMTQKQGVIAALYRTQSNGTIAYLAGTAACGPGTQYVQFTDVLSDAVLSLKPTLYTEGNAVLENIAPPPSMILWTNNNRLWCIDSENPETKIEYSKTASQGSGISFSTGQLELVIDSRAGEITGASPMDEKTVILKKNGLGYFIGDGANDSGTGESITSFQFIPSDVGCVNSKSVILYPDGVIFKSLKGLYKVNRGGQVSYFGSDVEAYNSQDVRAALIVSSKNQIRFLTSSGSSLLYDYAMNQWSIFTNHTGYSSDTYSGLYVYVRADGAIYLENTTSFLDSAAAFAPYIQLQWVKGQSIQNYERIRKIMLLGDYQNGSSSGHGVQISSAYDFGTTYSTPIPYYFGASSSSGSFQYREGLPRQKCDAISLVIQEITTGASGEFVDFTDLAFEIGIKKGMNKLPGSKSV